MLPYKPDVESPFFKVLTQERSMYICNLVGAKHRPHPTQGLVSILKPGTELTLQREPTNPYDSFAVQVRDPLGDRLYGYIPKHIAAELAPKMDAGEPFACFVKRQNKLAPELWVGRRDSKEWFERSMKLVKVPLDGAS